MHVGPRPREKENRWRRQGEEALSVMPMVSNSSPNKADERSVEPERNDRRQFASKTWPRGGGRKRGNIFDGFLRPSEMGHSLGSLLSESYSGSD